jgi:hypothetical protein
MNTKHTSHAAQWRVQGFQTHVLAFAAEGGPDFAAGRFDFLVLVPDVGTAHAQRFNPGEGFDQLEQRLGASVVQVDVHAFFSRDAIAGIEARSRHAYDPPTVDPGDSS